MKYTTLDNKITIYNADFVDVIKEWEPPTCIISDGPYGVNGYPGDPKSPNNLAEIYRPFIEEWSKYSTPNTTLWFWNTEIGWATVHPVLVELGWEYIGCNIWNKGISHVAGNTNTKTIRKFPIATEVCAQYVKKATINVKDQKMSLQDWLRYEWKRTGLPLSRTNEVCGVKNAATRKYFTSCELWYFPPSEAFEKIVNYANIFGEPTQRPFFSIDGINPLTKDAWDKMRSKFNCPLGITNVWNIPPLNGAERLKINGKSIHFNQKPLKIMDLLINSSSDIGDIIWEPFGGLCSASLAGMKLKRKCYSAEINNQVFEFAKKRIIDFESNLTFDF